MELMGPRPENLMMMERRGGGGGGAAGILMGEGMKQMLAKPIQLADQVTKLAGDAYTQAQRPECTELKDRTEKLAALLRQAARSDLYERPARRIMDDTEHVLVKALALVEKCRSHGFVRRLFTIIPATSFTKMSNMLDNSIADISWLIRVSTANNADDDDLHGLPPIAQNEPILFLIWDHIATLHTGSIDARADSAAALASLARDNSHFAKLIVEEEGVGPLLRLLKEGRLEGQENAARALGFLGRDPESVDYLVSAGACSAFAKVLKDGPMKVQAAVAWAVAELAANQPKCQDVFAQNNVVRFLVGHLALETIQEHSKYSIPSKSNSLHSVVLANKAGTSTAYAGASSDDLDEHNLIRHPLGAQARSAGSQLHSVIQSTIADKLAKGQNQNSSSSSINSNGTVSWKPQQLPLSAPNHKGRESEDPATKANMKAMAAKALWQLAIGNVAICKSITESRALLCFAVLLEKGVGDIQYNSAMALMEIARVAEHNPDLRHTAFKPSSSAAKAVIDQLLQIVEKGEYNVLLIPSISALGCLARTFRQSETRIIGPLVRLLDETEPAVAREAVIALIKFTCTENHLHTVHSKAIIEAGGAKHLVQLVYLGDQVQTEALVLLCYIAQYVPESEELAQAGVLAVLLWASKQQHMVQDPRVDVLLPEAKTRMELYQSRTSR